MDSLTEFYIPQLVLTPPPEYGDELSHKFSTRTTLGVIIQLLSNANEQLTIVSPFFSSQSFKKPNPVKEAITSALERNVNIVLISNKKGINIFLNNFLEGDYKRNLKAYSPKSTTEDLNVLGSHAKVIISDKNAAYVGSANFTSAGMHSNLELGLLVKGKMVIQLLQFWEYLVKTDFLVRII